MTKFELVQIFPKISPTAIKERDGEIVIIGKFCIVASLGGNQWDLWICNPKDITKGLTTRKIRILLRNLAQEASFTELTGETYTNLQGADLISNNLDLLGIRKKRQLSEDQLQKMTDRLERMRGLHEEKKHAA